MTRAPTNIAASVRARLLKLAKERREEECIQPPAKGRYDAAAAP